MLLLVGFANSINIINISNISVLIRVCVLNQNIDRYHIDYVRTN